MKKFSIVSEKNQNKSYEVKATITLVIDAESEGDAGYEADSILKSVENGHDFTIENIEEQSNFEK